MKNLFRRQTGLSFSAVRRRFQTWLPWLFVVLFAVSRMPGLLPPNFSVAYAFAFCAGVYFRGAWAWWLPLGVMLATDMTLNVFYYHVSPFGFYLLTNYAIYALLIGLGKWIGHRAPFLTLFLGGLAGAVIFYVISNTLAWWDNPGYARTLAGWIQALTLGLPTVHPTTWELFRNTLLSGGLFTALFVGAEKMASAESPADKTAGAPNEEGETTAEEANA